jgi:hypothetical protein
MVKERGIERYREFLIAVKDNASDASNFYDRAKLASAEDSAL